MRLLKCKITNTAVIYARFSSPDQESGLERQVERLKEYCSVRGYSVVGIVADAASGLNEDRRGLKKLIEYVLDCEVGVMVVSYKDRLTSFGFGYLEEFFRSYGVRIEVFSVENLKTYSKNMSKT